MKEAMVTIKISESELDTMIATISFVREFAALKLIPNKELLKDLKKIKKEMDEARPKNGSTIKSSRFKYSGEYSGAGA